MNMNQKPEPQTLDLVILRADKDGQLMAFNHPVMHQFSSEYMLIVARALKDLSKGIKKEGEARAVLEAQRAGDALS